MYEEELISVLMCVYKEPIEWVKQSVRSILDQSYENIQFVIVIDNPDRCDVVNYLNEIDSSKINYYVNEQNKGFVASLNFGIDKCMGNYIARMDADDISLPDRLKMQYRYLRDNNLELVAGNYISIDSEGHRITQTNLPRTQSAIYILLGILPGMPHPTWLLKKEVFEKCGKYRQIEATEDYDLLTRCVVSGIKMGLVEAPCLLYRVNSNSITQTKKGRQKVITAILKEQIKKKTVFNIDEINQRILYNRDLIEKYTDYFSFTTYVKSIFRRRTDLLKELPSIFLRFRVCFIILAFHEWYKKRVRALICCYDRLMTLRGK